jgi:hypothetical protein
MNVLVNESLHLIVSVDVERVSIQGDALGLVVGGLERVDDEFELNTTVGGENILGFDSCEFKGPVHDENNLGSEIGDIHVGVVALEVVDSLLGEVARNVEEIIGNQEVWVRFLNEALDWGLSDFVWDLGEVSLVLEDERV